MASHQAIKMTVEISPCSRVSEPWGTSTGDVAITTPRSSMSTVSQNTSLSPPVQPATTYPKTTISQDLSELFAENVVAKLYRTAVEPAIHASDSGARNFNFIPIAFPEEVPHDGPEAGRYAMRHPEFWTCGFFPGSLHCLLERLIRYPQSIQLSSRRPLISENPVDIVQLRSDVQALCHSWAKPLHAMASRKDTHDVGFMVMPALQKSWELTSNTESLESILRAADSLSSRFLSSAGAIRSWDERIQKNLQITCQKTNCILIIDSMCNLDLLYYAASHSRNEHLHDIATAHATTLLRTHLRPEPSIVTAEDAYRGQWYSTYHVANLDPTTGIIKQQFTAQGYSDTSTWARGQAWGILGYAQAYMWTKDRKFLEASCGLSEYFLYRLETSPACVEMKAGEGMVDMATGRHRRGRYVPLWDFDAPIENVANPTRDSSAGAVAANGMLVLSQGLAGLGYDRLATRFRVASLDLMRDLVNFALAPEKAQLASGADGQLEAKDVSPGHTFAGLLRYGTANNNENALRRYANHGLVYGDYYLMEYGNRLLRMGFD